MRFIGSWSARACEYQFIHHDEITTLLCTSCYKQKGIKICSQLNITCYIFIVQRKRGKTNDTFSNGKLPVVCAKMEKDLLISWEELFEGFDEIYIITYSSGIDFANKLIDKFKYSEIVFGYDGIVGTGFHAIMAVEINIIKKIVNKRSAEELSKKINEGALNIYISRDIKSHEKIYCLKSSDGRKRVITGSANLSASAFSGVQRENIICYDDEKAFNYYYTLYKDFRDECSDSVDAFTLKAALKKRR